MDLIFLLILIIVFAFIWGSQFIQLMVLSDDDFPGRFDKILWVVERTHSWPNRFRRLLIRWEKKTDNHFALLEFACAYFTLKRAGVFR